MSKPAGLTFEPVNEHGILTVHADDEFFPFSATDKAKLVAQIDAAMKVVQFDFSPVQVAGKSVAFTRADQARVIRQAALHWLGGARVMSSEEMRRTKCESPNQIRMTNDE
ncbi:MAG TPA: hypothetical protein VLI90_06355 [Tepidisphaeraceae bacterium]|nr:hypothetical protein [Tepidisphaeraceae bacterium]